MRLLSRKKANKGGLTLVELLVAASVSSLLLGSVCGIYFTIASDWQRQQGQQDAMDATSSACTRLSDYVSKCTTGYILTRFTTADTLAIALPADQAHGEFVPVWDGGEFKTRTGNWIVFYLSDSTGSYYRNGDILWAGSMNWYGFPASVVPDKKWSLYYNSSKGNISGIKSLKFIVPGGTDKPYLTITVTSSYRVRGKIKTITRSKTISSKNLIT
jgi:hypothetical protein